MERPAGKLCQVAMPCPSHIEYVLIILQGRTQPYLIELVKSHMIPSMLYKLGGRSQA